VAARNYCRIIAAFAHCFAFAAKVVAFARMAAVAAHFALPLARTAIVKRSRKVAATVRQMVAMLRAGLFEGHRMVCCRKSLALSLVQHYLMELKAS